MSALYLRPLVALGGTAASPVSISCRGRPPVASCIFSDGPLYSEENKSRRVSAQIERKVPERGERERRWGQERRGAYLSEGPAAAAAASPSHLDVGDRR
ncbi:hypothetical protein ZWY2020_012539 [Hordeum vulgare]|nr:hypothetical protein ZWY2020_012539 [Hordeum vulgare]